MSKARSWFKKLGDKSKGTSLELRTGVIDAKTLSRIIKHAGKIKGYATSKRLNLKNSPPYLLGIMIDTEAHFDLIFKSNKFDDLKADLYLNLFVARFVEHAKIMHQHFKSNFEDMTNERSHSRRVLNKQTLVFSHMLAELQAVYKGGKLFEDFTIVKREAREFWKNNFGTTVCLSWEDFVAPFRVIHPLQSDAEEKALLKTMDLLENGHISWFEFDIFTRLFQPWGQLLNNWNVIVMRHPGYKAFMTYDEVEKILSKHKDKPGTYVFRLSCTRLGQWAIGFVSTSNSVVQTIPQSKSLYQALIDGAKDGTYRYPDGQQKNLDITQQIRVAPEEHIQVTKEQYDIYCDIDSSFELCKICNTNLKAVRIDPCGHLLCKQCLVSWMKKGHKVKGAVACPFCREPVLSTDDIVVDPFDPRNATASSEADDGTVDHILNEAVGSPRLSSSVDDDFASDSNGSSKTSTRENSGRNFSDRDLTGIRHSSQLEKTEEESLDHLLDMGFSRSDAVAALAKANNNLQQAVAHLMDLS